MMFAQEGKPARGLEGEETAALPAGRPAFSLPFALPSSAAGTVVRASREQQAGTTPPSFRYLKNGLKPITEMSRSRGHSNSKLGNSMAEMNAAMYEKQCVHSFPATRAHMVRGRIDRSRMMLAAPGELPFQGELVLGRKVSRGREPLLPNSIHTFLNPVAAAAIVAANSATSGMPDRFHGHGQQARAAGKERASKPGGRAGSTGSFMCLRYS